MAGESRKWLLRKPSSDAPARLFCFPYSGVGASMYNRWPSRTGSVEICSVQLPGRENRIREPHYGTYDVLAEQAAEALEPYLDRPFGFFGHCGGALAAFATALRLQRLGGHLPACLFVSSQVAPHQPPYGRFLTMTGDELREELALLTIAMGGRPHPDALDFGLDILRADISANQKYQLAAPVMISTDLHAIGWSGDVEIRPDQMGGWQEYAAEDRLFRTVLAGEHHTFLSAPESLLDVFDRGLTRAAVTSGQAVSD
ncbi:thioesterase [Solihabitans fulvus]|uniref:Thioesterase n=1 Tax=Solihabitans fulvus TaxID=1892852 RepID=A0A5B2WSG0_9PSEU|nr:thioesterase domain-containing protein [Solihabitans fulvus]KAA2254641.1 thioesterase [Solihabitans fulvus]